MNRLDLDLALSSTLRAPLQKRGKALEDRIIVQRRAVGQCVEGSGQRGGQAQRVHQVGLHCKRYLNVCDVFDFAIYMLNIKEQVHW